METRYYPAKSGKWRFEISGTEDDAKIGCFGAIIHCEYVLHKIQQSGMMGPDCYVQAICAEDEKDKKLRKIRERIRDLEKDFE